MWLDLACLLKCQLKLHWLVPRLVLMSNNLLCFQPQAQPTCVPVQKAWLMGVIPVVMDCESTVQEKALECLDQLLLQNIKHHKKFHSADRSQVLAWSLLALLTIENQDLRYIDCILHISYRRPCIVLLCFKELFFILCVWIFCLCVCVCVCVANGLLDLFSPLVLTLSH